MADVDVPSEPDLRRAAISGFSLELRKLREGAGTPSLRTMAARSGRISHTTLHDCVSGVRLPSWETTREFVRVCGGDEAVWHARWSAAAAVTTDVPADQVPQTPEPKPRQWRVRVAVAVVGVLLLGAGALLALRPSSVTPPDDASVTSGPVVPGDASSFIGDITIPDGTQVAPGLRFTKVWEIKNSGTVIWRDRYLKRIDLPAAPDSCKTVDQVPIGNTLPNESIKISVDVTAPMTAPTTCMIKWKMVDSEGRQFFPSSRPVYFLVRVEA